MLLYQLKFVRRIFVKNGFFSALNILGLALGIAVSVILLLVLQSDLSYDQHYVNHRKIFRVGAHYQITGVDEEIAIVARELAPVLRSNYPEIEAMASIRPLDRQLVQYEGQQDSKAFHETDIVQSDSEYFSVFDHPFLSGNATTCLSDDHDAVITAKIASKYFGDEDPIGKYLSIEGALWRVTAVIEDLKENSHLKFDILLAGLKDYREWGQGNVEPVSLKFWNPDVYLYLLLPDNYDIANFGKKWPAIYTEYFKPAGDEFGGNNTPILERLTDIHFYSNLQDGEAHGNLAYLKAFVGIGILIIVLAAINYMNLATAKAANRAIEIGVKKIVGAGRGTLVLSILIESVLLSLMALMMALAVVAVVIEGTSFNQVINKSMTLDGLLDPSVLLITVVIAVTIGIISGIYPAFHLTNIQPVVALKGKRKAWRGFGLRKVLILVQFSISMLIVTYTLYMSEQLDFIMQKDLGFDKDNLLVVPLQDSAMKKKIPVVKNDLLQDPRITAITSAQQITGLGLGGVVYCEGKNGMQEHGGIPVLFVGDDYLKTMGMKLVMGRDFQHGPSADETRAYIANQSLVEFMEWGDDALGKNVHLWEGQNPGHVIGVVENFNLNPLYMGVDPMLIVLGQGSSRFLLLRLSGEDIPGTIELVKRKWSSFGPTHPFEFFFLDQHLNEQYREHINQSTLFSTLAWICVFISALGLLGLSAYTATQRTREIGVRKVLGAGFLDIIALLSREVLLLVIFSAALVLPVSNWLVQQWMQNFAYRAPIDYSIFLIIVLAALGSVYVVVLFQSFRTARSNPIDALKYE